MKYTVKRPVEIDVKFVRVVVPVPQEDEELPNDFPFRTGDVWDVVISVDTGKIPDWPKRAAVVAMKVVDQGSYYLLDANREVLASIESEYVPNELIPGSYGVYINLKIAEDGTVTNWPKRPRVGQFFPEE